MGQAAGAHHDGLGRPTRQPTRPRPSALARGLTHELRTQPPSWVARSASDDQLGSRRVTSVPKRKMLKVEWDSQGVRRGK